MGTASKEVKYPDIVVDLTSNDGNAFVVLGLVTKALKRAKVSAEEIEKFKDDAMSGDYNHLLQTCMKWVSVS